MTLVFASGTPHGGAVESTLSLAEQAVAVGYDVQVLVAAGNAYDYAPRLTGALVRVSRLNAGLGRQGWQLHDRFAHRSRPWAHPRLAVERARDVPSALCRAIAAGDTVVLNSMRRVDLERSVDIVAARQARAIWYLREASSLRHCAAIGPRVSVLVANSRPLASEASRLSSRSCAYVPSVIAREGLRAPTERTVFVSVNPSRDHGRSLVAELAAAWPRRRFALQESWPLNESEIREVQNAIAGLDNLELRRRRERSLVFDDAYAQLLPHDGGDFGLHRPRVALESQLVGVPIIATATPGLAAVAASSELLVPAGSDVGAWTSALQTLEANYEHFVDAARAFADAELLSNEEIWTLFAQSCGLSP